MNVLCPKPAALSAIPSGGECANMKFDQIIRFGAQRIQPDGSEPFDNTSSILLKASWDTQVAASDSEKIVFSPIFAGVTIPGSEGQFTGGNDNSTPYGAESYGGEQPVKVPFVFRNIVKEVIAAVRKLSAESLPINGAAGLSLYLINKDGYIICRKFGTGASAKYAGIPVLNLRLGSISSEGLNADNLSSGDFTLLPGWDENVVMIKPTDFNPVSAFPLA